MPRIAAALLLIAAPVVAQPHGGAASSRSMPELSDLALAACAAGGVWFARAKLRARFRRKD
jgi:hypothetical protein